MELITIMIIKTTITITEKEEINNNEKEYD